MPKTAFVKVYGDQYLLKEDAVAWAMLVNGAINYNITETDKTKKFDVNTLKITMGYRDYATQVYVELKEQLGRGNQAANPIWTNPAAANRWISEHKKDWQTEYMSVIGEGQPLHGVGNSKHGWGLAIDFNTQDPGSEFYRILDKDQEYKGYVYKKGQRVGCEQTEGPKIDSLTAYNEFAGTPTNYGKGAAQTPQVMWLEKNAKDFGFKPYKKEESIEKYPLNYRETWHWNYDPSEV